MSGVLFPRGRLVEQLLPARATAEQWQTARRMGLGGTDAAAIAGVNPFVTPLDVYLAKTGQAAPLVPNEPMKWGTLLEDLLAREWARQHGRTVRRVGLIRDAAHPHRIASLDRIVLQPGTLRAQSIWEGKTTAARNDRDWATGLWGEFGRLPANYLCQVTWYLGITGLELAHVACLLGGQRLVEVTVPFDPDLYQALAQDADAFWARHITACQPPEPTVQDLPRLAQLYPELVEDPVELDQAAQDAVALYAAGKAQAKALEDEQKAHELVIKTALKTHQIGMANGTPVVTWREQPRRDLDRRALKADQPDTYAKYETTSTIRVLRLTGQREDNT